jgi:hypothetical protein
MRGGGGRCVAAWGLSRRGDAVPCLSRLSVRVGGEGARSAAPSFGVWAAAQPGLFWPVRLVAVVVASNESGLPAPALKEEGRAWVALGSIFHDTQQAA